MDYLSGLNASFLHLETATVPMHAGSLMLLDVPNEHRTGFLDELQRHVTARMPAVPLLTRKVQAVPFALSNPVWVTDENVDLDHHVRSHTLPDGGSMQELERLVGVLHALPLDRARPLWELHLVDGLAEGKLALYAKIHHAAVDGIGATAIMQAFADPAPGEAAPRPDAGAGPHSQPGSVSLLSAAFAHAFGEAFNMARHLPDGLRSIAAMRSPMPAAAPRTPFNVSIGAERSVATLQFGQEDISFVAQAFAGTANDVLLAIVDGALRRYLQAAGTLPHQALVAAVPVNLRERADGHLSNHVSLWRTELATCVADVAARMRAIVHNTHTMRTGIAALRPLVLSDFPGVGVPWMMGGAALVAEHARLAETLPPVANVIVSHVAGPAQAPHIAGAKVLAAYPVSIVAHGLALNVTAQRCCGMLDVGVVAAASAMPDLPRFVNDLRASHDELLAAARALPAGGQDDVAVAAEPPAAAAKAGPNPPSTAGAARGPARRRAGAAPAAGRAARSKGS